MGIYTISITYAYGSAGRRMVGFKARRPKRIKLDNSQIPECRSAGLSLFFSSPFHHDRACAKFKNRLQVGAFSKFLLIYYSFQFFQYQQDNIKLVKRSKDKYKKIENNIFHRWVQKTAKNRAYSETNSHYTLLLKNALFCLKNICIFYCMQLCKLYFKKKN